MTMKTISTNEINEHDDENQMMMMMMGGWDPHLPITREERDRKAGNKLTQRIEIAPVRQGTVDGKYPPYN